MQILFNAVMAATIASLLGLAAVAQPGSTPALDAEKAVIAALRRANNEAIATRDIEATMSIVADDYVAVGGSDGVLRSKDEMRKLWTADFASKIPRNQCVRTPGSIEVAEVGKILRAAESGRWRCRGDTPSGEAAPSGAYFAHWSKRSGQWRVVSDNYVTLACSGSAC
jgi:ketosteroid isomerase-like protein